MRTLRSLALASGGAAQQNGRDERVSCPPKRTRRLARFAPVGTSITHGEEMPTATLGVKGPLVAQTTPVIMFHSLITNDVANM